MSAALPRLSVDDLERLAARTWHGSEEEPYGQWLLRAGGGFTGRANSALVVGDPPAGLPEAVAAVGDWYRRRGLTPVAALPVPGSAAADAAFAAAGWQRDEDNLVLTGPLDGWSRGAPAVTVALAPEPDDAWLAGYRYRGAVLPPAAATVLRSGGGPLFASIRLDPVPAPLAAVARGVVEDGWLVLSAVTVDESYRRRGLATAVMAALADAARAPGARGCLLQVAASNTPALALYARLGFTEHHRYHYRTAPAD